MSVTVSSTGQQAYRQTIQAGNHTYYADVKPANGGQDTAPDPHQLLLGAWGACTNMTVQMYAKRKGWALDEVSTTLSESKNGSKSMIEKNIQVKGNLTPDQITMLKTIAEKCPVNKLIMGEKDLHSRLDKVG